MKLPRTHAPNLLCATFLIVTLIVLVSAKKFDCNQHLEYRDPDGINKCLPRLDMEPAMFEPCKSQLCFLFRREPPVVLLKNVLDGNDKLVFNATATIEEQSRSQKLFNCSDPESAFPGLGGILFDIMKRVSVDALCVWAGDTCTFNNLVQYTRKKADDGYQFGIAGFFLETEERKCFHDFSSPIGSESLLIIGQNQPGHEISHSAASQLHRPFEPGTWLVFGLVAVAILVVAFATAGCVSRDGGTFWDGITAVLTGSRDEAITSENEQVAAQLLGANVRRNAAFVSFRVSRPFFTFALIAFFGIFALFYELAAVHFLFRQQTRAIDKSVRKLSLEELRQYSVVEDTAIEASWVRLVNPDGRKFDVSKKEEFPWRRCSMPEECLEWVEDVTDDRTRFYVSFDTGGRHLIAENSDCGKMTIFMTKDVLHPFYGGWLYNRNVTPERRGEIDREVVTLRDNGEIQKMIETYVKDFSCNDTPNADIGPDVVLIPLGGLVGVPLVVSLLIVWYGMYAGQSTHTRDHNREDLRELAREIALETPKLNDRSSASSSSS